MATKTTKPATSLEISNSKKALADIIKSINSRTKSHYIETGRDLIRAVEILEHGRLGQWLKDNFGWSNSTARNYMNAAKLVDKCAKVADLQPSAVMALSAPSVPRSVEIEVLAELEAGNKPTVAAIKAKIKAARRPKPVKSADDTTEDAPSAPDLAAVPGAAYQDLLKLLKALGPQVANDAIREAFDLVKEDKPDAVAEEPSISIESEAPARPPSPAALLTADNSDDEIQDLVLGEAA